MTAVRYGIWLYPWDLFDFGPDRVAKELRDAGISDVCLATSYHSVRVLMPDNPRRHFFDAARAAFYFQPDADLWSEAGITPPISSLVAEYGDAVTVARDMTRGTQFRLVAWTVCLHDSALPRRLPGAAVVDVWGQRSQVAACVANPLTRRYASTLVRDIAPRVEMVQLEAAHWVAPHAVHAKVDCGQPNVLRHLSSYCVCEHCMSRVEAAGGDTERLRADLQRAGMRVLDESDAPVVADCDVQAYLAGSVRDLSAYQAARVGAVTSLTAELIAAGRPTPVEFVSYGDRGLAGVELDAVEREGAAVRVLAYGDPDAVRQSLADLTTAPDAPTAFGVGLSALRSDVADASALRTAHDVAVSSGARSITYYNFGLLNAQRKAWLRDLLHSQR
jgi:hypothetical protein